MAHLDNVEAWWSATLPFLTLFSAAYIYIMENNIGHVHRERRRIDGLEGNPVSADAQRMVEALAKHIQRQNRIALIALTPLGLLILFTQITGFHKGRLKQIISVSSCSQHDCRGKQCVDKVQRRTWGSSGA
jgi:hypothetical protein